MMQQNRFCGIIIKKSGLDAELPSSFQHVQGTYFLSSEKKDAFDGVRTETLKGWSSAILNGDLLQLSVDRVGVRSMYFIDHDDYFCFANTILALKEIPFVEMKVSKPGVLSFFLSSTTEKLLSNVNSLKGGETILYDLATHTFDLSEAIAYEDKRNYDQTEQVAIQTRNHINETVNDLTTAVPTSESASFLSGGIDSSVIASSLKLNKVSIPFITAMTGNSEIDEISFAQDVIGKLGLPEWHQVLVQNIEHDLEKLHLAMELPTTSMGTFMQYELMRFCAHQGIKHVIDGTGADALYAGHSYYQPIYWNSLIRKRKFSDLRKEVQHYNGQGKWFTFYGRNMMKYYFIPRFGIASKLKFHRRNNSLLEGLSPDLLATHLDVLETKPEIDLKDLNIFLANEFLNGGVRELLRFTDRIGKSFGVSSHPIFALNPELYQFALGIPAHLKIKNGISKYILREAFSDMLPDSVLNRQDKMGLVAPNNLWMKEHKELLLSYITDDLEDYFQVDKMKDLLSNAIDQSSTQENYKVFRFFSFAIWHKVVVK